MKVCVLGSAGFIGSAIFRELERKGQEVIGVDKYATQTNMICSDIAGLKGRVNEFKDVDFFIDASGSLKPIDYIQNFETAINSNWHSTMELVEFLNLVKPKGIVNISSAGAIYGECNLSASEDSKLQPVGWYGKMKLVEESLLNTLLSPRIRVIHARLTNPYGNSNPSSHGFIDNLCSKVQSNSPIELFFHREATRDFIHIDDAARMVVKLAESNLSGPFNIGVGKAERLSDIAEFVKTLVSGKVKYEVIHPLSQEVVQSNVSTKKYQQLFEQEKLIDVYDYLKKSVS